MPLSSYDQYEFRCCPQCGIEYAAPKTFMEECRKKPTITFYCPNGHPRHFAKGEADRLRDERDRLTQRLAQKEDEIRDLENRRRAAVGQVTKLKNRVNHGVCPCCNRTFENLQRHMATKHPTFTAEAAE